jgi:hypothetical protein
MSRNATPGTPAAPDQDAGALARAAPVQRLVKRREIAHDAGAILPAKHGYFAARLRPTPMPLWLRRKPQLTSGRENE